MFVASLTRHLVSAQRLFIGEHMVGNPSVIEGQTVNIKNLQTGLLV